MKNPFKRPDPEPLPPTKVIHETYGGTDECAHVFVRTLREYVSYTGDATPLLYGTEARECLNCKRIWASAVVYDR